VEKNPVEFHEKLLEEGGTVKFVTHYLCKTSLHYMYTQDIFIKFPTSMAIIDKITVKCKHVNKMRRSASDN
jgi:hypothetical protein